MIAVTLLPSLNRRRDARGRSGFGILALLVALTPACGSQRFRAGTELEPQDAAAAVTITAASEPSPTSETSTAAASSAADAGGSSATREASASVAVDSGASAVDVTSSRVNDASVTSLELDAGTHAATSNPSTPEAGGSSVATSEQVDASSEGGASDADGAPPVDAGGCRFGRFQEPSLVLGLGFDDRLWGPAISRDGQVLLFGYTGGDEDLFRATNTGNGARNFEDVTALEALNTGGNEGTPFLSSDGLTLYFYATRPGGPGDRDLWFATRTNTSDDFAEPHQLLGVNGESYDHLPWLSDDELTIYYTTEREGGLGRSDVWMATRLTKSDAFDGHQLVPGINSDSREDAIAFSADRLTAYFTTDRASDGDLDIWQATRASSDADFADPQAIDGLNSSAEDTNLALTGDGTRLYFSSGRGGQQRLWVAVRSCL